MVRSFYRSSVAALLAGLAVFVASIVLTRAFHVPEDVVFAPGLLLQRFLNALGAELPRRVAVLGTLVAWCLAADGVLMLVNKPWRATDGARAGD